MPKDVFRLDVAVQDPLGFKVLDTRLHVGKDVDDDTVWHWQRPACVQVFGQVALVAVLEDDPRLVITSSGHSLLDSKELHHVPVLQLLVHCNLMLDPLLQLSRHFPF